MGASHHICMVCENFSTLASRVPEILKGAKNIQKWIKIELKIFPTWENLT